MTDFGMSDVAGQEWARRVSGLGAQERERRLAAVNVLLEQPDDVCAPLESELYVLRAQLQAGPAGAAFAGTPGIRSLSPAEQAAISASRAGRTGQEHSECGDSCGDCVGLPPFAEARMRAYVEAHPGQEFTWDEEAGIVAVIIARPGGPEVIAWARDLAALLDQVGAPPAGDPS